MNELDVNEARRRLLQTLGESSKSYFSHLKAWFCMRISKEDFDSHARLLLPAHLIHLHNEFLLAVLTKCQSLCQPSSYVYSGRKPRPPVPVIAIPKPVEKKRPTTFQEALHTTIEIKPVMKTKPLKQKSKPLRVNFDNRFQPVEPASLLLPPSPLPSPDKPRSVRFCSRDLTLPDSALIHGRMLVAAWEAGLDLGCEDKAIEMVLQATHNFLRQLVVAVITTRKGYRLRENRLVHSIGLPTLNPWLHNSWSVTDTMSNSFATEINKTSEPPHVPSIPPTTQQAERDSAYYLACSSKERTDVLPPISVLDLFQTLQVKKSLIRSHTVYAVNMERISARLYHPDAPHSLVAT